MSLTSDKLAIGLSMGCAFHCLSGPLLITFLSGITLTNVAHELIHILLILIIIPISFFAMIIGYRKHQKLSSIYLVFWGFFFLILATLLEEYKVGTLEEKIPSLIGSLFLILGHFWNSRLINKQSNYISNNHY